MSARHVLAVCVMWLLLFHQFTRERTMSARHVLAVCVIWHMILPVIPVAYPNVAREFKKLVAEIGHKSTGRTLLYALYNSTLILRAKVLKIQKIQEIELNVHRTDAPLLVRQLRDVSYALEITINNVWKMNNLIRELEVKLELLTLKWEGEKRDGKPCIPTLTVQRFEVSNNASHTAVDRLTAGIRQSEYNLTVREGERTREGQLERQHRQRIDDVTKAASGANARMQRLEEQIMQLVGTEGVPDVNCNVGWEPFGGRCYRLVTCVDTPCSVDFARDDCIQFGSELTHVRSKAHSDWLRVMSSNRNLITGGNDRRVEERWEWPDGGSMDFGWENWSRGMRTSVDGDAHDCMLMDGRNLGHWTDYNCSKPLTNVVYVCESAAPGGRTL